MIKATGAQIIVTLLERQGITVVAGIPGGSVLPLYNEIARSSIRHILARHEQAAGFIAQGMARVSGTPAVCIATSGPGAVNLLTAVADARSDSVPLIAITGQVDSERIGTDAFQEVDTFGLSFPITKHSILIKRPEELLDAVPRAFKIAADGRAGPVLIDVPLDVQNAEAEFEAWPLPFVPRIHAADELPDAQIRNAAHLLSAAKKPLLFAGGGCNSAESAARIAEFCSVFQLPIAVSLMGIGCVPSDSELYLGMAGIHGMSAANAALREADLIIAAGIRFDERAAAPDRAVFMRKKIIHIDIDAAEINKIVPSALSIVFDAACVFAALTAFLRKNPAEFCAESEAAASARETWLRKMKAARKRDSFLLSAHSRRRHSPHRPDSAASSLLPLLPQFMLNAGLDAQNVIAASDVGQHQMWTARCYPFMRPRSFLTSGSLGTMGFALPAAIGAALACPGRRVLCISGDGSLLMNIQELATLAELHLDVTVLVFNNNALGLVRQQQEESYGGVYSASVYEKPVSLAAVAAAFGIPSFAIDAPRAMTCSEWEHAAYTCASASACRSDACSENVPWYMKAFPPAGSGPRFVCCNIPLSDSV
ncbi:MAG: thiamine pyrophosphate-binding protein [Bacteroides sp.]|nr:thiamine pyrophosphate-binding protein [Prevotella sp.]MCM1408675.1 thiamine pyrophosphate-binding protein [Treponema brennaborense]MCM1470536.1 thiamine pyrophosphate-binding protein [Bacteroides sp.]